MQSEIDAASVVWYHDRQLRERDWPVMCQGPVPSGVWEAIAANHRYNGLRWREDARTHRLDVPPAEIAAGRRLVERYDQKRGDARDAIDGALLAGLRGIVRRPDARVASATPGAMIDRLSALALQLQQMRVQARCADAEPGHAQACAGKLERLLAQRRDLMACLDALLTEARDGRAYFRRGSLAPLSGVLPHDVPPQDVPPHVLRQDLPTYLPPYLPPRPAHGAHP